MLALYHEEVSDLWTNLVLFYNFLKSLVLYLQPVAYLGIQSRVCMAS